MMDVNYFLDDAQNSRQGQFELDFADVITCFDLFETTLITECGKTLIINWTDAGFFKSYHVVEDRVSRVYEVIDMLRGMDVDGEMMQEILRGVGMEKQMLNQLMATMPFKDVQYEYGERFYAERCKVY